MKLGKLLKIAPCEICLYVSTTYDIFDDDYTEVFVGNYAKVPEHFLSQKVLVVGPSVDYNRLDIQIECYDG